MNDVYATMASKIFNKPYEECLEYKNNKAYFEGKCRRAAIKFAIMEEYQKQTNSPVWNLLKLNFPVLNDMPACNDTNEDFSLIEWLRNRIFS